MPVPCLFLLLSSRSERQLIKTWRRHTDTDMASLPSSHSIMQSYFANQSCDPFTPESQPCLLGNYVVYAVDVATPEHVASALKFTREHNIRPVVRSTGHE